MGRFFRVGNSFYEGEKPIDEHSSPTLANHYFIAYRISYCTTQPASLNSASIRKQNNEKGLQASETII